MTNDTRAAFEAFMLKQNAGVRLHRQRRELGGFYRTVTVQRAWEQWQAADRSSRRAAFEEIGQYLDGMHEKSNNQHNYYAYAANCIRALADEGVKL